MAAKFKAGAVGSSALVVSDEPHGRIYRLVQPRCEYWLQVRVGDEGREYISAAGSKGDVGTPMEPDPVEIHYLQPLLPELALAAFLTPGAIFRESIARAAWAACNCLHYGFIMDRMVRRGYSSKKDQTKGAALDKHKGTTARLEAAQAEFLALTDLQAMKVAPAALVLARRYNLGRRTVEKHMAAWRKKLGSARR